MYCWGSVSYFVSILFFCNLFIFSCIIRFCVCLSFFLFVLLSFYDSRNIKTNKVNRSKCCLSLYVILSPNRSLDSEQISFSCWLFVSRLFSIVTSQGDAAKNKFCNTSLDSVLFWLSPVALFIFDSQWWKYSVLSKTCDSWDFYFSCFASFVFPPTCEIVQD